MRKYVSRLTREDSIVVQTINRFSIANCFVLAAALAYYAAFSLPPILFITVSVLGAVVEPEDIRGEVERQLSDVIGEERVDEVEEMLDDANREEHNWLGSVVGGLMLLVGATGALVQLQYALNAIWEVRIPDVVSGIKDFFLKRIMSLGMLIVIFFLVLVSLVVNTAISSLGDQLDNYLPGRLSTGLILAIEFGLSLLIMTGVFAVMFKVLPDAKIGWRVVLPGSLMTALLFQAGKKGVGLYLAHASPGTMYGAAGSLAVLLLWVYYASLIVLFGASFTRALHDRYHRNVEPEEGAEPDVAEE